MKLARTAAVVVGAAAAIGFAAPAFASSHVAEHHAGETPNILAAGDRLCAVNWHGRVADGISVNNSKINDTCVRNAGHMDKDAMISVLNDACVGNWDWTNVLNVLDSNSTSVDDVCSDH
ncbi:MAG TPA: hypothetical protein VE172_08570 [Stackebrandtia sp.]|jgi:formylmethanofuran dehydrogenase subunit A|uniref:hypothetical protein n=1 Tax=Stackebrandtia sp. TaxID=2023065 RepID=UPI002D289A61|nr:hypothetical protein [Stackebrandtia sp.]HZE38854.1 hypothetical protein [Stackebrandtia sp.]